MRERVRERERERERKGEREKKRWRERKERKKKEERNREKRRGEGKGTKTGRKGEVRRVRIHEGRSQGNEEFRQFDLFFQMMTIVQNLVSLDTPGSAKLPPRPLPPLPPPSP